MSQENENEANKLTQTTDFLPSDGAHCSPSYSFYVEGVGDVTVIEMNGRLPLSSYPEKIAVYRASSSNSDIEVLSVNAKVCDEIGSQQCIQDHQHQSLQQWEASGSSDCFLENV